MDPELFGATLMSTGAGGLIVKFEAYHHTERAAHRHSYGGRAERNAVMFGPARLCLCLSLLRHSLVSHFACDRRAATLRSGQSEIGALKKKAGKLLRKRLTG